MPSEKTTGLRRLWHWVLCRVTRYHTWIDHDTVERCAVCGCGVYDSHDRKFDLDQRKAKS